jgi:uncharacterized phiE125 gp8 family phage protein
MSLKLITAPTVLAVSLAEVKLHLRVDLSDDDAMITSLIGAATEAAEQITLRALLPQTWELALDAFPEAFELTRIPVASVTSLKYLDAAGVDTTLSTSLYKLDVANDFAPAVVVPAYGETWPAARAEVNTVRLRYLAGYTNAEAVPNAIKQWIKLQVGTMYEAREGELVIQGGTAVKPGFADALLDRYRVWGA